MNRVRADPQEPEPAVARIDDGPGGRRCRKRTTRVVNLHRFVCHLAPVRRRRPWNVACEVRGMPRKSNGCLLLGLSAVIATTGTAHAQNADSTGASDTVTGSPLRPPGGGAAPSSITPDAVSAPGAPPPYDRRPEPAVPPSSPVTTAPPPPVLRRPPNQVADKEAPGMHAYQPNPPAATTESYGTQIVIGDLLGLALGVALGNSGSSLAAGTLLYFAASPVVHSVHGNPGRAVGGLLLHLTAPVAGALVGLAIDWSSCSSEQDFCLPAGVVFGILGGMVAATVIDAAVLARDVPVSSSPSRHAGLTPTFSVARAGGGALAGVAGRF